MLPARDMCRRLSDVTSRRVNKLAVTVADHILLRQTGISFAHDETCLDDLRATRDDVAGQRRATNLATAIREP
jgi:hypothetical protein